MATNFKSWRENCHTLQKLESNVVNKLQINAQSTSTCILFQCILITFSFIGSFVLKNQVLKTIYFSLFFLFKIDKALYIVHVFDLLEVSFSGHHNNKKGSNMTTIKRSNTIDFQRHVVSLKNTTCWIESWILARLKP